MALGGVITPEHTSWRWTASLPGCVEGQAAKLRASFIASVQASQWGGVAYSPAIRPRPLGPRQGGALPAGFAESRGGGLAMKLLHLILGALSLFVAIFLMLYARSWRLEVLCNLLGHRRSCA